MTDIQTLLDQRTDIWRRRDAAGLAAAYAEDAVVTSPMFPRAEGRAAIQRSFEVLFRTFPDWEMVFEPACVQGGRAMQPARVRATQTGEFMGLPGSGRRTEFDCVLILDFKDGLIVRERRVYDFTGLLIQLGVLRPKSAV